MAVLPTPMISTRSPISLDVAEGDRLEPVDADVDVGLDFVVATGEVELLAARGADADEDGVEALVESARMLVTGEL